MQHTIIATFEEYGDVLSWVIIPLELDLDGIVHSQGDVDEIRTYACHLDARWTDLEWQSKESYDVVEGALDFLAQVHVIDAKSRTRLGLGG